MRMPWNSHEWWLRQADQLAPLDCGKNPFHGPTLAKYVMTGLGRALIRKCAVCAWEGYVLIQEGIEAPRPPSGPQERSLHPPRVLEKVTKRKGPSKRFGKVDFSEVEE